MLLILDEVQSGLGRTGAWFAFEHESIVPDGLILGKALGGGVLPVSAFVGRRELMDVFTPGSHGSTFGGNPLAAAVGLEALRVIEERAELVARMAEDGRKSGRRAVAEMYAERAVEYRQYADTLRQAVLQSMEPLGSQVDEGGQDPEI